MKYLLIISVCLLALSCSKEKGCVCDHTTRGANSELTMWTSIVDTRESECYKYSIPWQIGINGTDTTTYTCSWEELPED